MNLVDLLPIIDQSIEVADAWDADADAIIAPGNCLETLRTIPNEAIKLIVTSPPYNIGKVYEQRVELAHYIEDMQPVLDELVRVLSPTGSLCWQVGNYINDGKVYPLDIYFFQAFLERGLAPRNRIIWHFEHGLHASNRFSGRYETLLWFTKGDAYTFDLDPVRVPTKYPGKTYHKGPKKGQPSSNPLGKNPGDFWRILQKDWESAVWIVPNVKAKHPEKTIHPCQFPIELVERCILAMTEKGDWVLDPYAGVASTVIAAIRNGRRGIGCEKEEAYVEVAHQRIEALANGTLPYRPLGKPVHQPTGREKVARVPATRLTKGESSTHSPMPV